MLRYGPLGMKIGASEAERHGEFDGNGLRVVRAQKIGVLSKKLYQKNFKFTK